MGGGSEASIRSTIITVGDELLIGTSVDTNSAWLSSRLSELGASPQRHHTVGDADAHIQAALAHAALDTDLIVVTGGLGPTRDDLTREAVAAFTGRELVRDPNLVARMEERFRSRGFDSLPESNLKQADVPTGAVVLPNENGTAPGLAILDQGILIILLPGVPREMRGIFCVHAAAEIEHRFADRLTPILRRSTFTTGISESLLSDRVEALLPDDLGPVRVAFLPSLTGVEVRLTARECGEETTAHWLDSVCGAIEPAVSPYRIAASGGDLVEVLFRLLESTARTVAVAESCTGGLLSKRLTDREGASRFFRGGVVAYDNGVKADLIGVDQALIDREGAVSEQVAGQLALGAASQLGTNCGIGITGIAGPGGGSVDKPVGTVWVAASLEGDVRVEHHLFGGDREAIRERSVQASLALLVRCLEEGA